MENYKTIYHCISYMYVPTSNQTVKCWWGQCQLGSEKSITNHPFHVMIKDVLYHLFRRKGRRKKGIRHRKQLFTIFSKKPFILNIYFFIKSLKFVTLIHLSAVRRLVDILDYADMESGVIAIVCRNVRIKWTTIKHLFHDWFLACPIFTYVTVPIFYFYEICKWGR